MSNIIKGNYIHYSQSEKVIIDSNIRTDNFNPLAFAKVEEEQILEETNEDIAASEDEIIPDLEEVNQYAETIINEARAKAEEIVSSAQAEALDILANSREQGKAEGYESGLADIEAMKEQIEQELNDRLEKQDEECARKMKLLEPQFAELTAKLIEKLTGIVVEDKKDLIMYLISSALKPIRGPKHFLIRVSKDDAPVVTQQKEELSGMLAEDATLEILEDTTLDKNQCFIETEDRLLDVSLDVQLKNLSEHLKMLANA